MIGNIDWGRDPYQMTITICKRHNQDKVLIKSNDLYIRSVNNFYYYKNNQLKFRILFICNSNLYFYVENNSISDLLYFDDYFKFKSTHNIDQDLVCAQYNSVLSQLKISKKINDDIKTNILKSLKCTF